MRRHNQRCHGKKIGGGTRSDRRRVHLGANYWSPGNGKVSPNFSTGRRRTIDIPAIFCSPGKHIQQGPVRRRDAVACEPVEALREFLTFVGGGDLGGNHHGSSCTRGCSVFIPERHGSN